jgi:hypothetical protein
MPEILHFMFFKMALAAILDYLEVRIIPKPYNNHSSGFVMPELVKKDTSFVLVAHLMPEILHFMFFKMALAAILNLEVRMLLCMRVHGRLHICDLIQFVILLQYNWIDLGLCDRSVGCPLHKFRQTSKKFEHVDLINIYIATWFLPSFS